jgi:iron(III) transport system substrate-binding protein
VSQVGLGEIAVCIAFSHDIMSKGIQQGYPIQLSFPQEGVGFEIGGVSLIKGGPELPRAKRFVDWLFTERAQALLAKWHHIPLNPTVAPSPMGQVAREMRKIPVDLYQSVGRHQHLLSRWRQVTGK